MRSKIFYYHKLSVLRKLARFPGKEEQAFAGLIRSQKILMHPLVSEAALNALVPVVIFPFYQPVVRKYKNILGYELLMCW